ncbi:histidinol-phosphate aminotransferase family protein [Myxococcota bacterium]|nr:histidinol-phosphate aminotransferase family protein [Myxococcota bacterium]MBU1432339.1 histidinol-phosphate aminotransferase family protein [Myxococcota bacterium]MBU1898115.1 histidinol-phosphate aminotransferase family protein [Myxococcota bacterium]
MPKSRLSVAPAVIKPTPEFRLAEPIQAISPYQAVSSLDEIQARPGLPAYKLDWNESTVPPSPKVAEAIRAFLDQAQHLNWYPVLNSANLAARLEAFYGVGRDRVLVTNGSDDALSTICTTYLNPEDPVLVISPTYQHFLVFAQSRGAQIIHHYAPDPFDKDIPGVLDALARAQPRLCYLVNPNNPTGVHYTPSEVARLLAAAPSTLFIVDEAYSEFAGITAIGLVEAYRNIIVTRTFSKAYGLAGLRVGYALARAEIIEDLKRVFNPKSVNVLAQLGAIAALDDQVHLRWFLDEVERSKRHIAAWCEVEGVPCQLTPANYVMLRFEQAPWVVRRLREEGIYVRDRSQMEQLQGYVRFSVGTLEQTKAVLLRLSAILRDFAALNHTGAARQ